MGGPTSPPRGRAAAAHSHEAPPTREVTGADVGATLFLPDSDLRQVTKRRVSPATIALRSRLPLQEGRGMESERQQIAVRAKTASTTFARLPAADQRPAAALD